MRQPPCIFLWIYHYKGMLMNRSSLLSTLLAATIVATGIPAAVNAAEPGRKPLRPDTDVETRITADNLT